MSFKKFVSPKRKTHKVQRNNAPFKTLKNYMFLGQKNWKANKNCNSYMDLWKYGQILTIQKFLTIKQLRFSKKRFLIWVYHIVLHYILNPNNKFGMWINIIIPFCDVPINNQSIFFDFENPLLLTNEFLSINNHTIFTTRIPEFSNREF